MSTAHTLDSPFCLTVPCSQGCERAIHWNGICHGT